jgi:hypothetical protein
MSVRTSCKPCSTPQVCDHSPSKQRPANACYIGNLFTPWFKLIARDFLYGWWDQLMARRNPSKHVEAKSLADLVDDRVVKVV